MLTGKQFLDISIEESFNRYKKGLGFLSDSEIMIEYDAFLLGLFIECYKKASKNINDLIGDGDYENNFIFKTYMSEKDAKTSKELRNNKDIIETSLYIIDEFSSKNKHIYGKARKILRCLKLYTESNNKKIIFFNNEELISTKFINYSISRKIIGYAYINDQDYTMMILDNIFDELAFEKSFLFKEFSDS